jgi:hypothetical protein
VKIKMLEDAPGSPDGIHVHDYQAGVEYDVTTSLGEAFVQHGHAELADTPATKPKGKPKPKAAAASKDAGAPPENKAG